MIAFNRAAPAAALLALGFSSLAQAQSGMPPLPDGTPASIEGYDTASMYKSFYQWTREKADKAVELWAWSAATGTSLFFDSAYVEFEWDTSPFRSYQGSITLTCESATESPLFGVSRVMLTDEQATEQCAWQLNLVDNPASAAAYLTSQNTPKGKLTYKAVDWSGYRDPAGFSKAPALRVRSFSARTCPAITAILDRLETVQLGRIDIEYQGEDTERAKGDWIEDVPYTRVTVKSRNAGKTMEISFSGQDSLTQSIRTDALAIAENCTQLP